MAMAMVVIYITCVCERVIVYMCVSVSLFVFVCVYCTNVIYVDSYPRTTLYSNSEFFDHHHCPLYRRWHQMVRVPVHESTVGIA